MRAASVEFIDKHLHPLQARLIKRPEDVQRGEKECAGAASGVEDRDICDRFVERPDQFRTFRVLNYVLRELADIQIQRYPSDQTLLIGATLGRENESWREQQKAGMP